MANGRDSCPICKLNDPKTRIDDDRISYECSRCGTFTITGSAESQACGDEANLHLSAWIREHSLFDAPVPALSSDFRDEVVENLPNLSPIEKQQKLIQAIAAMTLYPGREVVIVPEHDMTLAWARDEKEFSFYLTALYERGLVRINSEKPRALDDLVVPILISSEGWEYLDRLNKPRLTVEQAFVAMSFDEELKSIFEAGIKPAARRAGYRAKRVDSDRHLHKIDAKIISDIRESRFVVADVTQQRPGVYYEAGFAHGLGIPVIWTVRKDELKKVHFDTRQYNHIVWDSEDDLSSELEAMILATIGRGAA